MTMNRQRMLRFPPARGTPSQDNPFSNVGQYSYRQKAFKSFSDIEVQAQAGMEPMDLVTMDLQLLGQNEPPLAQPQTASSPVRSPLPATKTPFEATVTRTTPSPRSRDRSSPGRPRGAKRTSAPRPVPKAQQQDTQSQAPSSSISPPRAKLNYARRLSQRQRSESKEDSEDEDKSEEKDAWEDEDKSEEEDWLVKKEASEEGDLWGPGSDEGYPKSVSRQSSSMVNYSTFALRAFAKGRGIDDEWDTDEGEGGGMLPGSPPGAHPSESSGEDEGKNRSSLPPEAKAPADSGQRGHFRSRSLTVARRKLPDSSHTAESTKAVASRQAGHVSGTSTLAKQLHLAQPGH